MFGIFLVSTLVNKLLMRPVVEKTAEKERREGDLRFKHMQLRSSAESLAFHRSSQFELTKVNNKLSDVCRTQQSLYNRNFGVDVSVNLFAYTGAIASYLVIAVPIFSGAYDNLDGSELSQMISENAFVCMYLVFQLTQLVEITGTVAGMAASTHRVSELLEVLVVYQKQHQTCGYHGENEEEEEEEGEEGVVGATCQVVVTKSYMPPPPAGDSANSLSYLGSIAVELSHVTLSPPNSEAVLVADLSLQVVLGTNLLIMGHSSAGKSSLLRAMRGLWSVRMGEVSVNRDLAHRVFFLPQKPFFTNGTLREQVCYPLEVLTSVAVDLGEEKRILELLELTGMTDLTERCGGLDCEPGWNWHDVLSPGEQQRLAFVRMLYHQPLLAIVDEATSALSEEMELLLYSTCKASGITLVSVGHRKTLTQFHHRVLDLKGGPSGEWELRDLQSSTDSQN